MNSHLFDHSDIVIGDVVPWTWGSGVNYLEQHPTIFINVIKGMFQQLGNLCLLPINSLLSSWTGTHELRQKVSSVSLLKVVQSYQSAAARPL